MPYPDATAQTLRPRRYGPDATAQTLRPRRYGPDATVWTGLDRSGQVWTSVVKQNYLLNPALLFNSDTGITIILPIGLSFLYVIIFIVTASFGTSRGFE